MEQEKNEYMGLTKGNMCYNMDMCKMPPYMYGKCAGMYENMPCTNYMMPPYDNMFSNRTEMYMNPYGYNKMEPLENMYTKAYKALIVYVRKIMQKIMMDNMGMMPKAISKEKFNMYLNDLVSTVLKDEAKIKKLYMDLVDDEKTNDDREFCPFCSGMLKDTLSILLITELLRSGCVNCY